MADPSSSRQPSGLGDLFNALGSNNPVNMLGKTVEQFRAAVTGLIDVVATFKETLDNLNAIARRTNALLDEMEGPLRLMVPQLTRSAEQATQMMNTLSGPVDRVAPGLDQLAKTLSNPMVADFPRRLNEAMDVVSSIPKALGPLTQLAEAAGGLFGGARGSFTSPFRPRSTPPGPAVTVPVVSVPEVDLVRTPARSGTTAKRAPAKRVPKRAPAKRRGATTARPARTTTGAGGKKAAARKAPAKKAPAKKQATARKAPAKRGGATKAATRRAPAKRATPRA